MQAQAQAGGAVHRRKTEEALRRVEEAGRAADRARQEAESAAALAEERRMQLAVVLDALETLQAGTPGAFPSVRNRAARALLNACAAVRLHGL